MFTRDQLSAWLGQVHADGELAPHLFKLAFALMQIADANAFVSGVAAGKLATGEKVESLIARGHVHPVPNGFRLALRTPKLRRQRTAHLIPFPSTRRRSFVEKQARTMAKLSDEKAGGLPALSARDPGRLNATQRNRRGGDRALIARSATSNPLRTFSSGAPR